MTNFLFKTKKRKLIFSLFLVLLVIAPISFYFWNKQAGASWWNSDWFYRKAITVTNSSGSTLENFQVKILTNYDLSGDISSGKIQSDLDDLRFMINDGESLDYWIEDNTINSADIWIKIPSLQTSGATVYMYYGNPQATTQSDGNKVFDFFDDFNIFNETKWSATGDKSIANGKLTVTTGAVYSKNTVATTPQNKTIEMKAKYLNNANVSDDYSGINISEAQGTNSNNSWGHALAYNMTQLRAPYNLVAFGSDGSAGGYGIVDDVNIYDQTLNTDYIIGYTFQGASNIKYFVKDLNYADLGSVTPSGTWNYSFYLWLGLFKGVNSGTQDIDDVEVDWVRVRKYASSDPIMTIGQEEQGPSPVLYLPFDEGFGTTAHDETSNRNDGTIVGATWKDESMCKNGKCLEFDGTGDYVEIADNQSLDLSEEVTLEAWVKPTSTTPQNQTIISKEEKPADPTKIYRSVAPGATSAIAVGTSNAMNITGDRATFATALPDNVGVGDVIQYDDDDDGDIDSSDSLAFVTGRISNTQYTISNASGGAPNPVNSDNNWSIFRAYTSLANAESGIENTGIDSDLRNFDNWTAGGDATTDDVGKDLVAANQQWNIACYANGTTGDGNDFEINGWTTGVNSFINIYTPANRSEVGVTQRHSGKWDDNFYHLSITSYRAIYTYEEYVRVDGLQMFLTSISSIQNPPIFRSMINSANSAIYLSNNILRANYSILSSGYYGYGFKDDSSNLGNFYIFNNIFYNVTSPAGSASYAILINNGNAKIYNNTIYNSDACIAAISSTVVKNNITQDCITDFSGTLNSSSTNNLTNNAPSATNAFGATYTTGTTNGTTASKLINSGETFITKGVQIGSIIKNTTDNTYTYVTALDSETQLSIANDIFISGENYSIYKNKYGTASFISTTSGSEDFHLSPTDTVAKNSGADLSGDSVFPFNSDIDGQQRLDPQEGGTTAWDIGADEARATQIYRSVAPGKTDALETGAENSLTIVGNTATFQRALADNIGVGDVIQYDDDNDGDIDSSDSLAFVTGRISNTQYTISNASGGTPVPVNSDNDWSRFRAYTSLANAENGDENTGIDSDLRNFDTWSGGKDLVASKEQWNIVCYSNGTTADTTAVIVDGWTTGVQNFVKIYTPVSESEVGVSQRHSGKWDEGKYRIDIDSGNRALEQKDPYLKIEGLQIKLNTTISWGAGILSEYDQLFVNNCYVETTGSTIGGIVLGTADNGISKVFNNIVKGNSTYDNGANSGINISGGTSGNSSYIYNNTVIGFSRGIIANSGANPRVCKNNIAKGQSVSSYEITNSTGSNYNASDDSTSTGGSNDKINQTFNFVNEAGGDYHLSPTDTSARNAGTSSVSLSPPGEGWGEGLKYDIDGDKREIYDIGADEAVATKIYRSVGPGNTSALALGTDNDLTIADGIATFENPLPDRVGVGDALQYDDDNDGDIDVNDSIAFITARISNFKFQISNVSGGTAVPVSGDNNWSLFRSYISLANAESGIENTGIDSDLRNFDTWSGGKDIVASNEEWNIACYADGVDTTWPGIGGWITGVENFIKIYTPIDRNEVGASQRHRNIPSSGFVFNGRLTIEDRYVKIDGISFLGVGTQPGLMVYNIESGQGEIQISNCFSIFNYGSHYNYYFAGNPTTIKFKIYNNIAINLGSGHGFVYEPLGVTYYSYNNTSVTNTGNAFHSWGGILNFSNNLAYSYGGGKGFNGGAESRQFLNNASSDASADDFGGTGNKINQTFTFRDSANDDFRLAMTDTAAKGAGLNLSNDANLPIMNDIEGELRPSLVNSHQSSLATSYDIGADQISNTTHNNYSLNLKTDYPQANFSTGDNDQDNFSSGDINLTPNEWSHLVYKRSNDTEEIYLNGSKKDSGTISNFLKTNNGKLYLGAKDTNSTNSFKGFLDEVRIYPYARTEAEVKKDTTAGSSGRAAARASEGVGVAIGDSGNSLSDGLVGYWKMDETSWNGTVNEVKDASGNNNHGTRYGNATTGAGKFGNGGGFSQLGDYVNIKDSWEGNKRDYTASLWFKYEANNSTDLISTEEGGGDDSFRIQLNFASGKLYFGNGAGDVISTNIPSANVWHNVIARRKIDGYTDLFLNGVSVATLPNGEAGEIFYNYLDDNLAIGGRTDSFIGKIDEVRLYERFLDDHEIKQLYNYAPGPVLHLKMDEKSGTTAFDSSGNNNHGTLVNSPVWETGRINGGLKFNGNDTLVNIPTSSVLENLDYNITISGWLKGVGNTVNDELMTSYHGFGSGYFDLRYDSSGILKGAVADGSSPWVTSNANLNDNNWHHFTYIRDANGLKQYLYIDGKINDSDTTSANKLIDWETCPVFVGNSQGMDHGFAGSIDDVKIYNYARTQEQILEDMGAQNSSIIGSEGSGLKKPILDLSFDEGQGATAFDSSGNNNHGTLVSGTTGSNTTTTAMWDKGGKFGGAMEFDNTDDYINLGSSDSIDNIFAKGGTISTWLYIRSLGENNAGRIIDKSSATDAMNGWSFTMNTPYSFYFDKAFSGAHGHWIFSSQSNYNSWQHVVLTYDSSSTNNDPAVYINGKKANVSETISPSGTFVDDSAQNTIIGNLLTTGTRTFDGKIDEFKMYNYILSEDEIKTLYNDGSAMMMGNDESRDNNGTEVTGANKDYCIPGDTAKCDKPVLELKMDEMTGTTAKDTSGNGRNGTLRNGPVWDRGKVGNSLNFNGTSQDIINIPNVNIQGNFTISAWIKPETLSGERTIFYASSDFFVDLQNSVLVWRRVGANCLLNGSGVQTDVVANYGDVVAKDEWQYVTFVSDATNNKIYIYRNGKAVVDQAGKSDCVPTNNTENVGSTNSRYFDGNIDEVRIYDYARTPAQIAWDYNRGKPIGHWKMDEASGTQVDDWSGNANHGTMTNMDPIGDRVAGKNNKALDFDGTDDTVAISNFQFSSSNQFSMSQYVNFKTLATGKPIVGEWGGNQNNILIKTDDTNSDELKICIASSLTDACANYATTTDLNLTADQWIHIQAVYNGAGATNADKFKLYINGMSKALSFTGAIPATIQSASTAGITMGGNSGSYLNAILDDVKIYNYALTEEQIRLDYNNGAVNFR